MDVPSPKHALPPPAQGLARCDSPGAGQMLPGPLTLSEGTEARLTLEVRGARPRSRPSSYGAHEGPRFSLPPLPQSLVALSQLGSSLITGKTTTNSPVIHSLLPCQSGFIFFFICHIYMCLCIWKEQQCNLKARVVLVQETMTKLRLLLKSLWRRRSP